MQKNMFYMQIDTNDVKEIKDDSKLQFKEQRELNWAFFFPQVQIY